MEITEIVKLISGALSGHKEFIKNADTVECYYDNNNDIKKRKETTNKNKEENKNPLKNADNV